MKSFKRKVDVTDVINETESGMKMLSMRKPTKKDVEALKKFSSFNQEKNQWFLDEPVMILNHEMNLSIIFHLNQIKK
jgi:hypothetical protein